jgi:hypothetical protein
MATKSNPSLDAGLVKRGEAAPATAAEAVEPDAKVSPVFTAASRAGLLPPLPTPPKEVRATKRPTPKDYGYHMQSVKLTAAEYKLVRHIGFVLDKSYQDIYHEALRTWLAQHLEIPGVAEFLKATEQAEEMVKQQAGDASETGE